MVYHSNISHFREIQSQILRELNFDDLMQDLRYKHGYLNEVFTVYHPKWVKLQYYCKKEITCLPDTIYQEQ